jgi:hypothetical protein
MVMRDADNARPLSDDARLELSPNFSSMTRDAPRRAGIRNQAGSHERSAIHVPDRHRPIVILQRDVGLAVQVEVACPFNVPVSPGVGDHGGLADVVAAVHLPDSDGAIVVLHHNVGVAVVVEIAGPLNVPVGAGICDHA